MAQSAARDTLKVKSIDELVDKLPPLITGLVKTARASGGLSVTDKKVSNEKTVFKRLSPRILKAKTRNGKAFLARRVKIFMPAQWSKRF